MYKHTLLVLQNAKPTVEAQMAALLHDVGKSETQELIGDKVSFKGHEAVSADVARAIMKRLKFDNAVTNRVVAIVANHMRPHTLVRHGKVTPKALRRFMRKVGEETWEAVLDQAEADHLGRLPETENQVPMIREEIKRLREESGPVGETAVLDGGEVMETMGIKPGPQVGEAIRYLQEVEDDYANEGRKLSKDEAKVLLREKYAV